MTEALKFDQDKVPLHLIDPLWLSTTAQVLGFGKRKYAAWNWAKGTFEWHRLYRAALGHLHAWYLGEDNDPESGLPHLWHANCCLMFLTRYVHDGLGTDTRPRFPAVHHEQGPQPREDTPPGGGSGGGGGEDRGPLRGELRSATGPDAIRSRPGTQPDLHDQRVLDEAYEQQPRLTDADRAGLEDWLKRSRDWWLNEHGYSTAPKAR